MSFRRKILSALCFFVFCVCPALSFCQENGQEIALDTWKKMISFQPDKNISPKITIEETKYSDDTDTSMAEYWQPISDKCQQIFLEGFIKAEKLNQIDAFAAKYVSFFGQEGPVKDMRWILGCPTLAIHSDTIPDEHLSESFLKLAASYNRSVVENCLASKNFYTRIHWFTLWTGDRPFSRKNQLPDTDDFILYGNFLLRQYQEKKWNENDYQYWHYVRYTLSLIYLCGFEETALSFGKPLTPKNFDELYNRLKKHISLMMTRTIFDNQKLQYVVVDNHFPSIELPHHPFPDVKYSEDAEYLPRLSRQLCLEFSEDFRRRAAKIFQKKTVGSDSKPETGIEN